MPESPTATLAVLTFRRPDGLRKVLRSLVKVANESDDRFEIVEILVVDNDPDGSGRSTAATFTDQRIRYVHEVEPGVAAARNRALTEATGHVLVFIDDDEHAGPDWPGGLLAVMVETGAAMVGGPVRSVMPPAIPSWVHSIDFFDRDEPAHMSELDWLRSGNLAIDLAQIRAEDLRFDEAFGQTGGEDVRFSVLAKRSGLQLRWAANAIVYEDVAADRLTRKWIEARASAAMTNYVRANAPITGRRAATVVVRAAVRLMFALMSLIRGRLSNDEARTLLGGIELQRAKGAISGLRVAQTEERLRRHTQSVSSSDIRR